MKILTLKPEYENKPLKGLLTYFECTDGFGPHGSEWHYFWLLSGGPKIYDHDCDTGITCGQHICNLNRWARDCGKIDEET